MGIGKASGENRAVEAAKQAINSPLLELSIDGANGVLFNVSGGADLTMMEINEAANIITEFIDDEARVIFGAVTDENLKKGEIKVTVIATGFSDGNNNNKRISIDNVVDEEINFMNKEADYEKLNDETVFTDENMDNNDTEDDEKRDKFENDNKKNEVENNAFSSKISPVSTDDEYDVPAFIRKKIKKEK